MARKKTTKKKTKKKTTSKKATTKKRTSKKKASKKKVSPSEPTMNSELNELEDFLRSKAQVRESDHDMETLVGVLNSLDLEEESSSLPRGSRDLKEVAQVRKQQKERENVASWLDEQAEELSKLSTDSVTSDDLLQEFDTILTRGVFDKTSLDAMMTHEAIENLEKLYGEAESELLRARRKTMVLKMIVEKAHDLLKKQALTFLEKNDQPQPLEK